MKPEEILEGNELIAKFMGWQYCDYDGHLPPEWYIDNLNLAGIDFYESRYAAANLMFHCSYDWLMPVWFKISSMGNYTNISYTGKGWTKPKSPNHLECVITTWDKDNAENLDIGDFAMINFTPILYIYRTVVEFIKWHNEQQK